MPDSATPSITSRKSPRQTRSIRLVEAILEAAVQVLRTQGASRFTTSRVAERAGIAVGSLYQYFPNKASILFRLQADEWQQTTRLLRDILENSAVPAVQRLQRLTYAFLRSECDEAQVRIALADAAPLYRHAPETQQALATGSSVIRRFIDERLPAVDPARRERAADLVEATLTQVGASYSERVRSDADVVAYAAEMAEMFEAYLQKVGEGGERRQIP